MFLLLVHFVVQISPGKGKKCLVFTAETNNPDVLQKVLNLVYFRLLFLCCILIYS